MSPDSSGSSRQPENRDNRPEAGKRAAGNDPAGKPTGDKPTGDSRAPGRPMRKKTGPGPVRGGGPARGSVGPGRSAGAGGPGRGGAARSSGPTTGGTQRRGAARARDEFDERSARTAGQVKLVSLGGNHFELQPPECAIDRVDDVDEVEQMISAGEFEIARDELLYLVADCVGFITAHNLLGQLALEDEAMGLARGHFGFAYECGLDALPEGFRGKLPADAPGNAVFFAAGRGLARCLVALKQRPAAREVLNQLLAFDADDADTLDMLSQLDELEREKKST